MFDRRTTIARETRVWGLVVVAVVGVAMLLEALS